MSMPKWLIVNEKWRKWRLIHATKPRLANHKYIHSISANGGIENPGYLDTIVGVWSLSANKTQFDIRKSGLDANK
jgi:hypothetical protein